MRGRFEGRGLLGQRVESRLVLTGAAAIEASRKHDDEVKDILGQVFLEAGPFALMDHHYLDPLNLIQRKHEVDPKAKQAVFVSEHQMTDLASQDQLS